MVARVDSSLVSVSPGSDGERVSVVDQDAPAGPDLLAFVAFQAGSVQAVAAFEVADSSFGARSVLLQAALGAIRTGLLAACDEHPVRLEVVIVECLAGRADVEPAVERELGRSRAVPAPRPCRAAAACPRPGSRSGLDAGRISPLAPRRVCSVTSAICATCPNSFGFPSLPLRIGRASGSEIDTIRFVIASPATRCLICLLTFSQRSASSSNLPAARSFAFAPRPRALRLATAASFRASATERANSSPVWAVSARTSLFASPVRRRIVRVAARSLTPIDLERSRTRTRFSPTSFASLRPSPASALTPCDASPASVGYFRSASITVESIRTSRARNRFERVASTINIRVNSFTVSAPTRLVNFRIVDSSGTRSDKLIRQNRRR